MQKFKAFGLSLFLGMTICSCPLSSKSKKHHRAPPSQTVTPQWNSILSQTSETYAIASLLKVYQVYDSKGPIQLRRIGSINDGGYVVPELAMQEADLVIGYGISNDISFEASATTIYGIPSYGFDCTCPTVRPKQAGCYFIPSCIVGRNSAKNFSTSGTFDEHVNMLRASGKKIFVKMDIEGDEYNTMPDVLLHASEITGIVLEIHFVEENQVAQALNLLQMLEKDFLLVHVHGNNYCKDAFETNNSSGYITRVLELSYINRTLAESYEIKADQTHPTTFDMPNSPMLPDVEFLMMN